MSRPRPGNQAAIGRYIAQERKAKRPWKVIGRKVEEKYGVRYGRTRLSQLMRIYGGRSNL